eukprot:7322529-Alexandrium_andersonii.AAC.1
MARIVDRDLFPLPMPAELEAREEGARGACRRFRRRRARLAQEAAPARRVVRSLNWLAAGGALVSSASTASQPSAAQRSLLRSTGSRR